MEQARLVIAIVLSVLVFLAWQFFFVDREAVQKTAQKPEQAPTAEKQVKEAQPYTKESGIVATGKSGAADTQTSMPVRIPQSIMVDTPLYRVTLSEKGAGFSSIILKNYRETVQDDSLLKELLPQENPIETGLVGFVGKSLPGLDNAYFSSNRTVENIDVKDIAQEITFTWKSDLGVVVEKTYTFSPDTYMIGLDIAVKNGSGQAIQDKLFVALNSTVPNDKRMYGFEGPSTLIDKKLEEVDVNDIADQNTYSGNLKWVALQDRYFMMSVIPEQVGQASMQLYLKGQEFIEARFVLPDGAIGPGTQHTYQFSLFFGPKSMQILNDVGHSLNKALDFGMFDILAKPCVWLMNKLYSVIPNYGIAIIVLTILIKAILWPLGSKSYKSMSEMKKIQPLMKEIREKHKNDKKKMNEEVMSLYRTYKINPLGGCLPMVVQLPVFFALYRMLYQAIELRHAPFFLWIDDLSAPDRLFHFNIDSIPFMEPPYGIPVLTIIMGATMLLQQKMSPPMGDPTQAKMMMFMPLIFTVIFINFSAGLVLYWLVNNVLSISQQYYIQKKYA
ncbi:MAG: membrane protein insertase YidC [bacterium]|nr:membrane protein insertase YidC [bacterium]